MTTITARLAKWARQYWALVLAVCGAIIAWSVYLLRSKERGTAIGDEKIERFSDRWEEATAREATAIAIINAKDKAAKQELREIKREPDWRVRMEKMRELKERVMGEKS